MDLNELYIAFNRKYFAKRLPPAVVDWGNFSRDLIGKTYFIRERVGEGRKLMGVHIYINKSLAAIPHEITQMTLLHEMAHVSVGEGAQHRDKWKAEMIRLAKCGAFDGRW